MQKSDSKTDPIGEVWWRKPVETFLKMSGWVALPVVLALILGKYLDKRYDTSPWIFLGLTAVAFIISMVAIIMESVKYIKEISPEEKSENKNGDK